MVVLLVSLGLDHSLAALAPSVNLRHIGILVELSATPGRIRRRPPALGEHSREVLAEAGFGDGEVEALVKAGVVRLSQASES